MSTHLIKNVSILLTILFSLATLSYSQVPRNGYRQTLRVPTNRVSRNRLPIQNQRTNAYIRPLSQRQDTINCQYTRRSTDNRYIIPRPQNRRKPNQRSNPYSRPLSQRQDTINRQYTRRPANNRNIIQSPQNGRTSTANRRGNTYKTNSNIRKNRNSSRNVAVPGAMFGGAMGQNNSAQAYSIPRYQEEPRQVYKPQPITQHVNKIPHHFNPKTTITPKTIDLLIRTINVWDDGNADVPPFFERLPGIVALCKKDWSYMPGIVCTQEMPSYALPICMAHIMSNFFSANFNTLEIFNGNADNAIFASDQNWSSISNTSWQFGWSIKNLDKWRHKRYLQEVVLQHKTKGWIVRVYNTHFSHDQTDDGGRARPDYRLKQAEYACSKIMLRVKPDELPPIFAGDLNATKYYNGTTEPSLNHIEKYFYCTHDSTVPENRSLNADFIYIGRSNAFHQTSGSYQLLRTHDIKLDNLSDHHGFGISLKVNKEPFKGITAFEHTNFKGKYLNITKSIPDLKAKNMNDCISSIKLFGNVSANVYEHSNYKGKWMMVNNNKSRTSTILMNDNISSIQIVEY